MNPHSLDSEDEIQSQINCQTQWERQNRIYLERPLSILPVPNNHLKELVIEINRDTARHNLDLARRKRRHGLMMMSMLPKPTEHSGKIDKDELLKRCDIVSVYRLLHPSLTVIERGREVNCQAFCHDDKRPSLSLNPEKQFFYCHVCSSGGDLINLVMRSLDIEFKEALRWLSQNC